MPPVLSETLIWCVTLLLFGMGLIGTLIPMLPGIIIIAAGCIWQGVMGSHSLAWWEWTVLALLVAGGLVIDKISGGMGAKKFGSTSAGIWGTIIGAIVGAILFPPIVGLLVMPFLGRSWPNLFSPARTFPPHSRPGQAPPWECLRGFCLNSRAAC